MSLRATLQHALKTHGILAIASFIALVGLASTVEQTLEGSVLPSQASTVDIAIEYDKSLQIDINSLGKNGKGIIDIRSYASEPIYVSLPTGYNKRSVKNAELKAVSKTDVMLGFTRWTIPADSTVSFEGSPQPKHVLLHNPNNSSLQVSFTNVDLDTNETNSDILLIQKAAATLW